MSRFLILFNAPEPMGEFMQRHSVAERQAGLTAWTDWKLETEKTITFEFGAAVQRVADIPSTGVSGATNSTTNYAFAESESKDDVTRALSSHPHLQRAGATIEVLELLTMPS